MTQMFLGQSKQYPGGGGPQSKENIQHTASSEPGPTVGNDILQQDLAELLDRIGPAIVVTHSAGGASGWLAMAARPDKVKAVLAIEPVMGITDNLSSLITFSPALAAGEKIALEKLAAEKPGLNACELQPKDKVHTVPAFKGKPVTVCRLAAVLADVHAERALLGAHAEPAGREREAGPPGGLRPAGQWPLHERREQQRRHREEGVHPLPRRRSSKQGQSR